MISCRATRKRLLDVVRRTASDAVRLEIESHLDDCPGCRIERARWGLVGVLKAQPPPRLNLAAERRIIAHLVQTPPSRSTRRAVAPRPGTRALALAFGVVILAAGAFVLSFRYEGALQKMRGDDRLAEGQRLEEAKRGAISFGGARIEFESGTTMIVHPAGRQLTLSSGRVQVDVTEGLPGRFRVATSAFIVEVLGTRFVVTPSGVQTLRGHVRVLDLKGRELVALQAGESWTLPAADAQAEAPALAAPLPEPAAGSVVAPAQFEPLGRAAVLSPAPIERMAPSVLAPPRSERTVSSVLPPPPPSPERTVPAALTPPPLERAAGSMLTPPPPEHVVPSVLPPPPSERVALAALAPSARPQLAPTAPSARPILSSSTRADLPRPVSVIELLSLTRAALAEGDAIGARIWIERARAERPNESQAAMVDLLEADAWLVARQPDQAISAYRGVFRRRPGAPEGETAAFAVGQLLAERDAQFEAVAALNDYLVHYPQGRFAREARERLEQLQAVR